MFDERVLDGLRAAVAIEIIRDCGDSARDCHLPAECCRVLKRILMEPDYRTVAMDVWREVFQDNSGDRYRAMMEYLEHSSPWHRVLHQ